MVRATCLVLLVSVAHTHAGRVINNRVQVDQEENRESVSDCESNKLVIEFGGSGLKIIVYKDVNGSLLPDTNFGEKLDGVIRISNQAVVSEPDAIANDIKGNLTTNDLGKCPLAFFVSGGNIAKYGECTPGAKDYVASDCVPDPVKLVAAAFQIDPSTIVTDEAQMEAISILDGFATVTEKANPFPALILLAGSTTSQMVYFNQQGSSKSVTWTTKKSGEDNGEIIGKLETVLGNNSDGVANIFFCSNFAFAICRNDTVAKTSFMLKYFEGAEEVPDLNNGKYKPNHVAELVLLDVQEQVDQLRPPKRNLAVWDATKTLVHALSDSETGLNKTTTTYLFKELVTKDGRIIKAGASHGVAMSMTSGASHGVLFPFLTPNGVLMLVAWATCMLCR